MDAREAELREKEIMSRAQKEFAALRAERQGAAEAGLDNECRQPKPWVEASIEEKIERTREMVKSLHSTANYLDGRISELRSLRDDLIEHRHLEDGKVMLPADGGRKRLNDYGGCCNAAQEAPEKAYF